MFKRFLIWSSCSPHVWCSTTIYATLKEGIMRNIHVKLYGIWTSGSKDVFKDISYLELWQPFLFSRPEPYVKFWKKVP